MKRIQIDLPDYIMKMVDEICSSTDWKEKELIIRSIERMYRDYVEVQKDPVRLIRVYRNIEFVPESVNPSDWDPIIQKFIPKGV